MPREHMSHLHLHIKSVDFDPEASASCEPWDSNDDKRGLNFGRRLILQLEPNFPNQFILGLQKTHLNAQSMCLMVR